MISYFIFICVFHIFENHEISNEKNNFIELSTYQLRNYGVILQVTGNIAIWDNKKSGNEREIKPVIVILRFK